MADTKFYVPVQVAAPWHHKLLSAGAEACWLWLCGLCYCKMQLSDGFISSAAITTLPMGGSHEPVFQLADKLVVAGLWETAANGFRVHDYLAYNPGRDAIVALIETRRAAGTLGGLQRAAHLKQALEASASPSTPQASASSNPNVGAVAKTRQDKTSQDKTNQDKIGVDRKIGVELVGTDGVETLSRSTLAPPADPPSPTLLVFPTVGAKGREWVFTEAYRVELATGYPNLDVLAEARHAWAWIMADPKRRKTAGGMKAFLVSWLNRSTDHKRGGNGPITGSLKTAGNVAAARAFIQRHGGSK